MTDVTKLLADRLAPAFAEVAGEPAGSVDPAIRRSDHADYQADAALRLAKQLRRNPREVAAEVIERADLTGLVSSAEVAGPGFVNLTVDDAGLGRILETVAADERLGVSRVERPRRVLIDYSGPNVGKELHVGHMRSTIIGDAIARVFEYLGHEVIRKNHIGDWGTTFGMLIEHFVESGADPSDENFELGDLTEFYQEARQRFDGDPEFADRARRRVVLLQSGDADTLALWKLFIDESSKHFQAVYDELDITLTRDDIAGESTYNDGLPGLVEELDRLGLLVESDGALCLFPEGFTGRDGKPFPIIVRKQDGGYNYEATDLVAIRRRRRDLHAEQLRYVVAHEQHLRLEMLFQAAREAGWLRPPATAEHISFGLVLGPDRKRLRTRSGDLPKLADLLDEAVRRAEAVVIEKAPDLPPDERAKVARAVGIGAVKYGDLSADRVKDYMFDLDQMVSFDGNTAPYLQYAHARIQSVFRKGEVDPAELKGVAVRIGHPAERTLALRLLEFEGVVHRAADLVELHRIAGYLYELASTFTGFYEQCPVLRAEDEETRLSRLVLCDVTARTLATGLSLLGITAPSRM
ncbi:MAG TPA: arginine--tRNA ligase [Actinopolymorphaceae bacterium]